MLNNKKTGVQKPRTLLSCVTRHEEVMLGHAKDRKKMKRKKLH